MKNYYLYIYLDPRKPGIFTYENLITLFYEPIYVGKGTGNRCYSHIKEALNQDSIPYNAPKLYKIRNILKENQEPIVIKLTHGSEEFILDEEIKYITTIGRMIYNEGPLTNIKIDNSSFSPNKTNVKRKTNYQDGKTYITVLNEKTSETVQIEKHLLNVYENVGYKQIESWTRLRKNNNKSRKGHVNGMCGKSAVKGRRWITLADKSYFLTSDEIMQLTVPYIYGRKVTKNTRQRIIIENQTHAKYMSTNEIKELPAGTRYQIGLTWKNDESRILIKE